MQHWILVRIERHRAQSQNVLHNILGLAKIACRSGVCGWLLTSTKQKTKQNIARLVQKQVDINSSLICHLHLKNKEINVMLRVFSFTNQPLSSSCLKWVQPLVRTICCFVLYPHNLSFKNIKTESARRWSNKWTKTLYQDYLHCITNFCRALLIIFSKQFISSNTKRRKRMLNFVWNT